MLQNALPSLIRGSGSSGVKIYSKGSQTRLLSVKNSLKTAESSFSLSTLRARELYAITAV